jgi:hypothetical protein
MKWDDHRSWVLGSVAAAIIGFGVAVFSVVYGAYYNRTHHIAEWSALGNILRAQVPLWFVFPLGVLAAICLWKGYFYWRRNSYLEANAKEEAHWQTVADVLRTNRDSLEEKLAELERNEPKLHGVWNQAQAFWHKGRHGEEPMTQIGGWIDLTSSNTQDNIFLLAAYVDGRRSEIFIDVPVKPNIVNREMVMLFFHPPLHTFEGKPFEATIVVEDQFNRKYELPSQTFRATASPMPSRKPEPKLHASWLATSDWGWVGSSLVDEGFRTYIIRGEVTFLLENAPEPIYIVGVDIEGAKSMGDFENFALTSGQTEKRSMNLYFQGKAPEGNDHYEPALVFRDIKGNRYQTPPHRFIPLPIPERVAIERNPRGKMIAPRDGNS